MRLAMILAAAGLLIGTAAIPAAADTPARPQAQFQPQQTDAISAAQRKKRKSSARAGHRAYGRSGTQIACTQFGCNPIPRGCRIRTGFNPFTWDPSGFDEVVCPYYR